MSKVVNRTSSERGQSLVEVALGMVFLVVLLAGIIDLGRAYFAKIAITDAAAEGAMFASVNPWCVYTCADPNNVRFRVRHASESPLVDWERVDAAVSPLDMSQNVSGTPVTVTVEYNFPLITPFIATIVGQDTLYIRATAVQIVK